MKSLVWESGVSLRYVAVFFLRSILYWFYSFTITVESYFEICCLTIYYVDNINNKIPGLKGDLRRVPNLRHTQEAKLLFNVLERWLSASLYIYRLLLKLEEQSNLVILMVSFKHVLFKLMIAYNFAYCLCLSYFCLLCVHLHTNAHGHKLSQSRFWIRPNEWI